MITDTYPTFDELMQAHTTHPVETIGAFHRMLTIVRLFSQREYTGEEEILKLVRDAYGHHVTALAVHRDLFSLVEIGVIKLNEDCWSFSAVPESEFWPFGGEV